MLAGDLARRAGVRDTGGAVVAFSPALVDAAIVSGAVTSAPLYAVDGGDERRRRVRLGARRRRLPARATCASAARRASRGLGSDACGSRDPGRVDACTAIADQGRLLTADDLAAWTALGLALTSADLVGVMRGVLDITVAYAAERRQYGVPVGSFQAVQHLLAEAHCLMEGSLSVALHASWAVDNLAPGDALVGRPRRQGVLRTRGAHRVRDRGPGARRDRQHVGVHRARVPAPRVALVAVVRRRRCPAARARSASAWGWPMDFRDSPAEAEFRGRLRAWLAEHNPGLPASSTDDEYWARQAEWHTALYDAGFFGLSWPARFGGHDLPTVFDVILDEEIAAAGAPPRPSLGYLVQGISTHGSEAIKDRFLPGLISGRDRWCQGFSEPDAGSDLASLRTTATRDGDEYVINGHKIWTSYSDVADWCFLLARTDPDVPKHKGLSAFAVPMHQPGIEQRPLRMINGITTEFGQVLFDDARVPAENMIGAPGEGWRARDDDREPRARARRARLRRALREDGEGARARGARRSRRVSQRPARGGRVGATCRRRCCASTCAAGSPSGSTVSSTARAAPSTSC